MKLASVCNARATLRAYDSDVRHFHNWCAEAGAAPSVPETIEAYLMFLFDAKTPRGSQYAVATIERRLASIRNYHRERGDPDPTNYPSVEQTLLRIRHWSVRPIVRKAQLSMEQLLAGLNIGSQRNIDLRDNALALASFRRFRVFDVVSMDRDHLRFENEGVYVTMARRRLMFIPNGEDRNPCAVQTLRRWIDAAGITFGPVFRWVDRHDNIHGRLSVDAPPCIVKKICERASLDPVGYSWRSLGLSTPARFSHFG